METSKNPAIGDIIRYVLHKDNVRDINRRREDASKNREEMRSLKPGFQAHIGTPVKERDYCPAIVTAIHANFTINLKVFLDGSDDLWVTFIGYGHHPGSWVER